MKKGCKFWTNIQKILCHPKLDSSDLILPAAESGSLLYIADYQDDDDDDDDNYVGCARSDPNEPVSEKPLYDYLWPKDIDEEEDKVLNWQPFVSLNKHMLKAHMCIMLCVPYGVYYIIYGANTVSLIVFSPKCLYKYRLQFYVILSLSRSNLQYVAFDLYFVAGAY